MRKLESELYGKSHGRGILQTSSKRVENIVPEDNLGRFIPVGVVHWYHGRVSEVIPPLGSERAPVTEPECPLEDIKKLESHGWIRTSSIRNVKNTDWYSTRICVLPSDAGHLSLPRSAPAFRAALKKVMSNIDTSKEAWDGEADPFGKPEIDSKNDAESLFYIFNTLESPEPNPDAVGCQWARSAMEDLLWKGGPSESEEDAGVKGLKTPLYAYQRRSAALMVQKEVEPGEMLDPRFQCCKGPTGQTYYYDKEEGKILHERQMYANPRGGMCDIYFYLVERAANTVLSTRCFG